MDPDFERKYHALEDSHWWFQARRDCIARLLQYRLRLPADAQILEVGCSGGPLLQLLQNHGFHHLTGIDVSQSAIDACHNRGLTDIHLMDATTPLFPSRQFDLIIASDVLEHLDHAGAALANWARLLRPGGTLLVFVPAFMFLWSPHDTANRHYRRYTARALKRDLLHAGFLVRRTSYWNTALFPPVAAIRLAQRLLTKSPQKNQDHLAPANPLLNSLLLSLLKLENRLLTLGLRWPIGISALAIAQTPATMV